LAPGCPTREDKKIKLYEIQETSDSSGVDSVKRKRIEELDYSLGGASSGFVLKRAEGELKKRGGIFARAWPEWLMVETAFNLDL
jgi:hypothetical protein